MAKEEIFKVKELVEYLKMDEVIKRKWLFPNLPKSSQSSH